MILKDLLTQVDFFCENDSDLNIEISDIIYDSRKVSKGCLFVCLEGSSFDGHKFALEAVNKGATAIVASKKINIPNAKLILVNDTRKALAFMSVAFFEYPAKKLITIGLTGTKGKTTTSCMIKSILENANIKTGLIGTLGVVIGEKTFKTNNTTPESYEIQMYLRKMVDQGCKCAVIEASSLGLKWHRTSGFTYDYALFTNFSPDHIGENEHENIEEYKKCKSILFKNCKLGIINIDDPSYEDIIENHTCEITTFGFSKNADIIAYNEKLIHRPGYLGVHFDVHGKVDLGIDVDIPGKFSVYNALAAIAVCINLNVSKQAIIDGLNNVKVKGRVEPVKVPGKFTLLIDYAHNAVSMENILKTLREYNPNRLICMFGAGGNRAKSRRYEMGEISGNLADLSVITADNSRFEDVMDIINDIKVGINKTNGKFIVIPDRKQAIKYCIQNAQENDIIVLAGKGHEDYQEIKGVKHHFDEREIIADILKELGY